MDEEQKVSRRYRELGAEEPPRHVDDAILAASRRAADVHPAPLVPPTGRRRWYFPLAAAAVIMLSVAVTWHMQVERPDPDGYVAPPPAPTEERAAQAAAKPESQALMRAPEEEKRAQEALAAKRRDPAPREKREVEGSAAARAPAPAEPFTPDPPQASRDRAPEVAASRADPRMRESAPMAGARAPEAPAADALFRKQLAEEPPEKVLERIAELRKQAKHDEADKALEEFRKRYPDYKIPDAALRLPK